MTSKRFYTQKADELAMVIDHLTKARQLLARVRAREAGHGQGDDIDVHYFDEVTKNLRTAVDDLFCTATDAFALADIHR